jgi:hypothetical protein
VRPARRARGDPFPAAAQDHQAAHDLDAAAEPGVAERFLQIRARQLHVHEVAVQAVDRERRLEQRRVRDRAQDRLGGRRHRVARLEGDGRRAHRALPSSR